MGSQQNLLDGVVASEVADLRRKAKESESKALEGYRINNYHLLELDKMLTDVFYGGRPISADYVSRRDLVLCLNAMAKEIYRNPNNAPVVEAYGSFVMDMFSQQSDLDLSISFGNSASELPRDKKIQILRRFAKKLRRLQRQGHVTEVQTIISAKVPIVKFLDKGTGVECDLSVENKDGILKSQLIRIISGIDDRFQQLSVLMKCWAKSHDINSSRDRTLNSLSIILLVAFHLQTREPPILPPFSLLFKDGTNPPDVARKVQNFLNWGRRNEESLGRLFVTLLIKLQSVECLWNQGLCISLLDGSWISKTWGKGVGSIKVEDFADPSQNVARAVGGEGAEKIYSSIQRSNKHLLDFLNGKIGVSHLKHILFGSSPATVPPIPPAVHPKPHSNENQFYNQPEHHHHHYNHHAKRRRLTEGHRDPQADACREMESFNGFNGKRIRYAESFSAPETAHYVPGLPAQNPLRIPPSLSGVPFHGTSRGPMVPLHGPLSFNGPPRSFPYQPVDLPPAYVGRIDPALYHTASHDYYHAENYSEPYSRRLFL